MVSSGERLVLFDIDGTLIDGGALWRECFETALARVFPELSIERIAYAGKTDYQICRETLVSGGVPEEEARPGSGGRAHAALREYLSLARHHLKTRSSEVSVLPGVRELLERLTREPHARVGLLTGNLREGAELKLSCVGLESHFDFELGAYGDDHWDRYELPRIAVGRARRKTGREFKGRDVVILGDTIHDVKCGKSIGVRSIAVGTGKRIDQSELRAAGPDSYFADFSDADAVLEAILS